MNSESESPKTPATNTVEGTVEEALPNNMFRVKTDDGDFKLASISTTLRRYTIKIIPGDRVTIEVSTYDPSRGRITHRHT
jgi:translation initiation factor IF-1